MGVNTKFTTWSCCTPTQYIKNLPYNIMQHRLIVFWQTEGGGGASLPPTPHRLYVPEKSAFVKQISIFWKWKNNMISYFSTVSKFLACLGWRLKWLFPIGHNVVVVTFTRFYVEVNESKHQNMFWFWPIRNWI